MRKLYKILITCIIVVVVIVLYVIIGGSSQTCYSIQGEFTCIPVDDSGIQVRHLKANEVVKIPNDWIQYSIGGEYELSVPQTVELRNDFDEYTHLLKSYQLPLNEDAVVFQQKGLSGRKSDALNKYCRVMLQYIGGGYGDFMTKYETELLDEKWADLFYEMVISNIGPSSSLIGKIDYCWREINGQKYIEVEYKRTGANFDSSIPVVCKICLFQNSNEMVKMMLSYREQEAELWEEDFELIVKTFKWL